MPSSQPFSGAWFYDATNHLWRADHYSPQTNNFCTCGMKTTDSCSLYFTKTDMYVHFPDHPDTCCRLCAAADGCSILKPDWLSSDAKFTASEVINGRAANQYCLPGADAAADCMSYADDDGVTPLRYSETFNFPGMVVTHNLTFTSFEAQSVDPAYFTLPATCNKDCPSLFPACMAPSTNTKTTKKVYLRDE